MKREGAFYTGSRIYMMDFREELVLEAIVMRNDSDDDGYDYDLRVVNVNEGDPGDIKMGTTINYKGIYGEGEWSLLER